MGRTRKKTRRRRDEDAQTITLSANWLMVALIAVIVLTGVGAAGWYFGQDDPQPTQAASANQQGEFTTLQEAPQSQPASQQASSAAQESTDSQFLGPETDAEGLAKAEAGELGQPALVWFHADWCHVCQAIKPTVAEIEKKWDGRVDLVRLNVDHPEARDAVRQYRVRGTPTFVFISPSGEIVDNMVGWAGQGHIEQKLTEMLAMN